MRQGGVYSSGGTSHIPAPGDGFDGCEVVLQLRLDQVLAELAGRESARWKNKLTFVEFLFVDVVGPGM